MERLLNMDFDIFNDDVEIVEILLHGFPRRVYDRHDYFSELDDKEFFRRFRLKKATVLFLLDQIQHQLEYHSDRNNSVSPIQQLLLTLRFYATDQHLLSVSDFAGMHISTVSRLVAKVTGCIAGLSTQYIKLPSTAEEIAITKDRFFNIASFPNVVAAIDGTHIKILSPGGNDAEIFRNRKHYFSLNVQAACNADMEFTDMVVRWPGSAHDATIFNNSRMKQRFEAGQFPNCIILGDGAYNLRRYFMTPVINPATAAEQLYNESQIRTRGIIERTFGVWKRRFPVLAYGCRLKLETTRSITIATAVLQNIARMHREEEPPLSDDENDYRLRNLIADGDILLVAGNDRINAGNDVRRSLINNYFTR